MHERDTPEEPVAGQTDAYEPPRIEDLPAPEGLTVTPAGIPHSPPTAAPRDL
jgi:hypothetical protein